MLVGFQSFVLSLANGACPLGAHYLPLPTPEAREVSDWLHEIGLLRQVLGRTVADERHLCHSPQERLFIGGAWAAAAGLPWWWLAVGILAGVAVFAVARSYVELVRVMIDMLLPK